MSSNQDRTHDGPHDGTPPPDRLRAARRQALDHVLDGIATSRWSNHLVLRGSALLPAWFGSDAREPADLDFVVVPDTWAADGPKADELIDGVAWSAESASWRDWNGEVRVSAEHAAPDELWTYDPPVSSALWIEDTVAGRRLVLPWTCAGIPDGTVQVDFAFGERLPVPSAPVLLPRADGGEPLMLNAADPELSLVWKLRWLLSDSRPQGKDLYDAWLLATAVAPDHRLLMDVLVAADPRFAVRRPTVEAIAGIQPDWDEFREEHPDVRGDGAEYARQLAEALAPVLAGEERPGGSEYARRAVLLAAYTDGYRDVYAERGAAGAAARLCADILPLGVAIVIVNELRGGGPDGIGESMRIVLRAYDDAGDRFYRVNPRLVEDALRELRG